MSQIFFLFLCGGLGGLLGWGITEPFSPDDLFNEAGWARWELLFSLSVGGFIGLAVGGASGKVQGSRAHLLRGLIGGLLLGAIGAVIGLKIGGVLATLFFGPAVFVPSPDPSALPVRMMARTLVFLPFGALIGMVQGIATRSLQRGIQGMIGGLIGGAMGGAAFDILGEVFGQLILAARSETMGEVGEVSRATASVTMGAFIGLFVGIVERMARKAWVRLELGRNEGKEWIVDAHSTFIGRSENAHIPLFGDPSIAPMHACIVRGGGRYRLVDGGSPVGIGVNGIRVPEAFLNHGDVINVGSYSLRFMMRGAPSIAPRPVDAPRPSASPVAMGPIPGMQPISQPPQSQPATAVVQAPTSSGLSLVALDGPITGQRFEIGLTELVLGREAPGVTLSFDPSASRRHASLQLTLGGVLVRDLGSTNGTLLNGVRIQEATAKPGDTVRIGSTTFRIEP